jgi:hypothetical protein
LVVASSDLPKVVRLLPIFFPFSVLTKWHGSWLLSRFEFMEEKSFSIMDKERRQHATTMLG